ncbi:HsdM family class I SAM-dependent methyltransferase [Burkholderia ambifaria]|jgi:type I restriction enzyme M protein|uniref:HsdM family class I SAM-dependent methyltransferase n=1 Tax=Burkholderia ambifaria TaxID=152480 RepID=UPI00158C222A|nr:class I SAM-dependent DNA methyltransferase [Burkholderia ambifaria]
MLDLQRQHAIRSAIWQACDLFRGVSGPGKDLTMAMLLLKYVSDISRSPNDLGDVGGDAQRFVVPSASSFYALSSARLESGNGRRIDKALGEIEQANDELRGAFDVISFDATTLGNVEQKDRLLCQLLDVFHANALDFRANRENATEAVAYACDSIIKYVAGGGKLGTEFFTPSEMCQLIARLVQPEDGDAISDPCCGSGSLLIACSQLAHERSGRGACHLYGQEKNGSAWALARMNMVLHGETQYQLEWGDTLRDPKLLGAGGHLRKFEIVVSSPPFSLKDWGHEGAERDAHQRYWRGVPPRMSGDYAFISHMVETLQPETGRMAVVVTHGVLFRGAAEGQIRERLLQENLIDAVIGLPPKMFANTSIPVAILVLRKGRVDDSVLFIDASRSYQPGKIQNVLRPTDLDLIEDTYLGRRDVSQYARLVTRTEIAANDSNLNVARYVDTTEIESEIDLNALRLERARLTVELENLEAKLAALIAGGGHA